jgi:hypothetical protein
VGGSYCNKLSSSLEGSCHHHRIPLVEGKWDVLHVAGGFVWSRWLHNFLRHMEFWDIITFDAYIIFPGTWNLGTLREGDLKRMSFYK